MYVFNKFEIFFDKVIIFNSFLKIFIETKLMMILIKKEMVRETKLYKNTKLK